MSRLEAPINEIVENIWSSVLGLPVVPEDPFRLAGEQGRTFAGVIQISGAWDGAVAVHCSEALARRASTAMFGIAGADVGSADLQDTIGELANMTGGNIKALLPEPCTLGLPVVVEGEDFRFRLPGSSQVLQCAFRSDGEPFTVTVLERVVASVDA